MPAKKKTKKQIVLVTGASGFIAKHCIVRLLNEGYSVRGSLRSLERADEVHAAIATKASTDDLTFVELNLSSDEGWPAAMQGCDFVQHVASPFPNSEPKDENELIIPAREGALRAVRAAAKAGVKRVVLTSSMAAIAYGHDHDDDYVYDEKDWSKIDGNIGAYLKSKTIAEKAAWDFMDSAEAGGMELSVINPGAVLGPLLDNTYSTSGDLLGKLLKGEVPACPKIGFSCIDVRDVADAHFAAMTKPEAAGRRYLCIGEYAWMLDISKILSGAGYKTPTKTMPNFIVHILAVFDKTIRMIKSGLDKKTNCNNERLRSELGIEPRSIKEMTLSMAESMVKFGAVSPKMR
ncbi:MAG: aldehyde reductase [Robiginitomaculum sp.]|nr:aldehyde reductase [Robiginitomaculum sp.]